VQLVDFPTRENNTLDLILVDDMSLITHVCADVPLGTSDHVTVQFKINLLAYCDRVTPTERDNDCWHSFGNFNLVRADWAQIALILSNIDWVTVFMCCADVDSCWNAFFMIALNAVSTCAPPRRAPKLNNKLRVGNLSSCKSRKMRGCKRVFYPKHLRKLNIHKKKIWRKFRSKRTALNREAYKKIANKFKAEMAKHTIFKENSLIKKGNLKEFYNYVNKKTKNKSTIPPLHDHAGNLVFEDSHKAEMLNAYFKSVFKHDNGIIPKMDNPALNVPGISLSSVYFPPDKISCQIKS